MDDVSKCKMKASIYIISAWKLLSLQNCLKNVQYFIVLVKPYSLLKVSRNTIHIVHPMRLVICHCHYCHICCMLLCRHGDDPFGHTSRFPQIPPWLSHNVYNKTTTSY